MPAAQENRSAVFTRSPQDVEIYRANAWWPGSLLGWRHDADGGCQAWVRVTTGGAEETTWLALDYLRLPEPEAAAVEAVVECVVESMVESPASDAFTGTMAAIRAVPLPAARRPGPEASSEVTATMNLAAVRDLPGNGTGERAERGAGGRRRAPEQATGELPAADASPTPTPGRTSPGRHRAPAPLGGIAGGVLAGRHRAADTGVLTAVRDDAAPADTAPEVARIGGRTELPPRPRRSSSAPSSNGPDAHLLTRPMRLGDLAGPLEGAVPQPRPSARDGRLTGV